MPTRKLPAPSATRAPADRPSVLDEVSQQLLAAVLDGTFGPGARLPAERDLAAQLGTSRVVVREALRRLQEWRVVQTRRGSGATVLPRRAFSGMALGAALVHAVRVGDLAAGQALIEDALALRRALLLELVERAAPALAGGSLAGPRDAVEEAWRLREDPEAFLVADREIIPWLLERAGMLASLWTLNTLGEVYLAAMAVVAPRFAVPRSYRTAMRRLLDALEQGDGAEAREALHRYLDDLDANVRASLPAELRHG